MKTSFDTVEIRYYPFVLSDNPGSKYGPPIELGWDYSIGKEEKAEVQNVKRLSLYERERQWKRRSTRTLLYLSQVRREAMLREANYTEEEMCRAVQRKNRVRRQRFVSNILVNPATKVSEMVRNRTRAKKLARANKNLQNMKGDGLFHEHSKIYHGWWIPSHVNA